MSTLHEIKKHLETLTWRPFSIDRVLDVIEQNKQNFTTIESQFFYAMLAFSILNEYDPEHFPNAITFSTLITKSPSPTGYKVIGRVCEFQDNLGDEYRMIFYQLRSWIHEQFENTTNPEVSHGSRA